MQNKQNKLSTRSEKTMASTESVNKSTLLEDCCDNETPLAQSDQVTDNSHTFKVQAMLIKFQREALFCDTVLMTKDGGRVYAHSTLLAAVCPALLSVLNQHPLTNLCQNIVDLSLFDADVVADFVKFIYTGKYEKSECQTAVRELLKTVGVSLTDGDELANTKYQEKSFEIKPMLNNTQNNDHQLQNKTSNFREVNGYNNVVCFDEVNARILKVSSAKQLTCDGVVKSSQNNVSANNSVPKRRGRPPRSTRIVSDNNLNIVNASNNSFEIDLVTTGLDAVEELEIANLLSSQSAVAQCNLKKPRNQISKLLVTAEKRNQQKLLVQNLEEVTVKEEADILNEVLNKDSIAVDSRESTIYAVTKTDNFSCPFCDFTFQSARRLDRHKWSHYQSEDGMYVCKICGKIHEQRDSLRKHVRLHEVGSKRFMCTVCGHRVQNLTRLKSHMNTHTNARPNVCEVCGLCFNDVEYLTKHMRHHTGDMRYECRFCHKRFIRNDSKKKHERGHTGEKPYQCQTCLTRFTSAIGLKYHMFQHSGERPHRCSQCQKSFRSATRLRQHIRSVHIDNSEKPCPCEICGKAFAINSYLKQHMLIHTGRGLESNRKNRKRTVEVKSLASRASNSLEESNIETT